MTTYLTQEQASDLSKEAGLDWHAGFAIDDELNRYQVLCNAAIQAYRDSLASGVVPELPESDWLLHMPARPYESKWTSNQTGYEACQMENYARQAIADDRARQQDQLQDIAAFIGVGGYNGATTEQLIERIKSEFQRLIDALAKQVPQWLPIETAPKDGTVFLGYKEGRVREAYRVQRDDCEMWCFGGTSADVEVAPWTKPTYWMQLLAAPDPKEAV